MYFGMLYCFYSDARLYANGVQRRLLCSNRTCGSRRSECDAEFRSNLVCYVFIKCVVKEDVSALSSLLVDNINVTFFLCKTLHCISHSYVNRLEFFLLEQKWLQKLFLPLFLL